MKSPIVVLPFVVEVAVIALLYFAATASPTSPATPQATHPLSEIRSLHQQRDLIQARIYELEGRTRVFLPRGMGRVYNEAPTNVSSLTPSTSENSR